MAGNLEDFRRMFIDIESYLRRITRTKTHRSFNDLVAIASSTNQTVRFFERRLRHYATVRNIISHNNDVVAEFTPEFIHNVKEVRDAIVNPPTVNKYFRKVVNLEIYAPLTHVLELIAVNNFSQFPVYDGSTFRGLLTENGITRWLALNRSEVTFNITDTTVADILNYDEHGGLYQFVDPRLSVPEAVLLFSQTLNSPLGRLEALFITESGLPKDPLLGIITTWDIVNERSILLGNV